MAKSKTTQPIRNRIVIGISLIMLYGIIFPFLYNLPFIQRLAINLAIMPILGWSLLFGWVGGLIIGLLIPFINIALLFLLGDSDYYLNQSLSFWAVHMFYALVGILFGAIQCIKQEKVNKAFVKVNTDKRLHYLATHDPLTRLPNRTLLFDRMQHAMSVSERRKKLMGVMFIDMNNFKMVNDNFGHATGDKILIIIAERLQSCLRESDTVARLGGDEFVVLLEGIQSQQAITQAGQKILDYIVKPILIGEVTFSISASIGVSLYPWDSNKIETLLEYADEAMYRAKSKGYGTISFYSNDRDGAKNRDLYPYNEDGSD